jgi:hypothetical protein
MGLLKVWGEIKAVPRWAWAALAGAGTVMAYWLKLRRTEDRALKAENAASEARLDEATAQNQAEVAVEKERVEELGREREQVRFQTRREITRAEHMGDEDVTRWLQTDGAARKKDRP